MIPFEIAAEFLPKIVSGELVRHGAILKEAVTGKIVGHLKEIPSIVVNSGGLPNLIPGTSILQDAVTNIQLADIQKSLNVLQLTATIGTVSSIMTLGVCISGFGMVLEKLNIMDKKLDDILIKLEDIKQFLLQHNQEIKDILLESGIITASEKIKMAENSLDKENSRDLLRSARDRFMEIGNAYYLLFINGKVWENSQFSIEEAERMFMRFIVCCMAQLHCEFLLGDFGSFQELNRIIIEKIEKLSAFDSSEILINRIYSEGVPLMLQKDCKALARKITAFLNSKKEIIAQVETMKNEREFLEIKKINPGEYLKELKKLEPGFVLIPY